MSRLDFDVHEHEALHDAKAGDMRKLAACIRFGYPLSKQARAVVAEFLETATPMQPDHRPSNPHRALEDVAIAEAVEDLMFEGSSRDEAITTVAEERHKSFDTIEKRMKNGRRLLKEYRVIK